MNDSNTLHVTIPEPMNDETAEKTKARIFNNPATGSAITRKEFLAKSLGRFADLSTILDDLHQQEIALSSGNMSYVENMLLSQAAALDAVFTGLASRAANNLDKGEYFKAGEMYLRLALKAQNQCRATLETLADVKNPKTLTITRQANIAEQQIVNNGNLNTGGGNAPAQEKQNPKNELLGKVEHEKIDGERLDTRKTRTAGGTNQDVEALGEIHRGKNTRG